MFIRQGLGLTLAGPATYASISTAMIAAAAVATNLPSRRATHLDPIVALRDK